MLSWPVQTRCQVSSGPLRLRSIGAQTEFTVAGIGEKVAPRSPVCAAVRHFDDSCGGPATPPLSIWAVIFHSPGSMPSATAAEAANASAANITIATQR